MIKYSVVIPMYNSEKTIIKAVESILNQTKYDLIDEIIIVNDGSKDSSLAIVEQYKKDKKLDLIKIIDKKNGGAASARNIGISSTRNNWIALLDADDIWLPSKIERQNEVLVNNPNIRALGTNRIGELTKHGSEVFEKIYKLTPFQYCVKNWPCTPSIIFDKTIFNNDVYFNETMSHAEEGIFFLDLAAKSGLYYLTDALVLCGDGKPAFGHSGLSGNIKKMHLGVLKMHYLARDKRYITCFQKYILDIFENIKYIRRLLIIKKKKNEKE